MTHLSLSLFGRSQVLLGEEPVLSFRTKKVQALLVYLAARPTIPHRRETLMTLLWPGMPDESARANLRQILFLLRQAIPDFGEDGSTPLLIANRDTMQLNPQAGVESDLAQLDAVGHAAELGVVCDADKRNANCREGNSKRS